MKYEKKNGLDQIRTVASRNTKVPKALEAASITIICTIVLEYNYLNKNSNDSLLSTQ
jgi:hypothetical protein